MKLKDAISEASLANKCPVYVIQESSTKYFVADAPYEGWYLKYFKGKQIDKNLNVSKESRGTKKFKEIQRLNQTLIQNQTEMKKAKKVTKTAAKKVTAKKTAAKKTSTKKSTSKSDGPAAADKFSQESGLKALAKRPTEFFNLVTKGKSILNDLKEPGQCSGGLIRKMIWSGVLTLNEDKTVSLTKGIKKTDLPEVNTEPVKITRAKKKEAKQAKVKGGRRKK